MMFGKGKLCIFLFIMAELICGVEIKENKTNESISHLNPKKEITMEYLDKRIEDLILIVERNRKRSRNLIRNFLAPMKKELTIFIDDLKNELNIGKSEILKLKDTMTSEMKKVHMEMNNANLNISGENKIITDQLNEMKFQSEIYNINIETEFNKTINEFQELKEFKVRSDTHNNNIDIELVKMNELVNKTNKLAESNKNKLVEIASQITELNDANQFSTHTNDANLSSPIQLNDANSFSTNDANPYYIQLNNANQFSQFNRARPFSTSNKDDRTFHEMSITSQRGDVIYDHNTKTYREPPPPPLNNVQTYCEPPILPPLNNVQTYRAAPILPPLNNVQTYREPPILSPLNNMQTYRAAPILPPLKNVHVHHHQHRHHSNFNGFA